MMIIFFLQHLLIHLCTGMWEVCHRIRFTSDIRNDSNWCFPQSLSVLKINQGLIRSVIFHKQTFTSADAVVQFIFTSVYWPTPSSYVLCMCDFLDKGRV